MSFKRVFILIALFMAPSHPALSADMTCKANYFGEIKCKEDSDNGFDELDQRAIARSEALGKSMRQNLGALTGADTRTTEEKRQDYYSKQQQEIARGKRLREQEKAAHERKMREMERQKHLLELELLRKKNQLQSEPGKRNQKDSEKDENAYIQKKDNKISNYNAPLTKCIKLDGYELLKMTIEGYAKCPGGWLRAE